MVAASSLLVLHIRLLQSYKQVLLYAVEPLPFVHSSVLPFHFSVSVSVVILKVALITRSVFPKIYPLAIFLVVHVLPFVRVSVYHLPYSSSMTHARKELPSVIGAIFPVVFPVSFRSSRLISTNIKISVRKYLNTFTLFFSLIVQNSDEQISSVGFDQRIALVVEFDS